MQLPLSGMDYGKFEDAYLRNIPNSIYLEYRSFLPENWRKRADHFIQKMLGLFLVLMLGKMEI